MPSPLSVLVTGATGYVGGRLVPRLLDAGYRVRCWSRDPSRLQGRSWLDRVEVVTGDVLRPETLRPALRGIDAAYYLIHSLAAGGGFSERDTAAARHFGEAARDEGVGRIIYLGGLGDPAAELSEHLRSRQETGDALREAGVPVTELRAAVIVGSGSLSFEMIRYLAERLPVMICPRWVYTRTQPIAIRNVLDYLVGALDHPESAGRVLEIGGADVVTYGEMMTGYAEVRGLGRRLIPVPVLTPRLSSYWVHLVTPIPAAIAQPLIEGLRNEVVVRDDAARRLFPEIQPFDYRDRGAAGARRASRPARSRPGGTTRWSRRWATRAGRADRARRDASSSGASASSTRRPTRSSASSSALGGQRGWLVMDWAWQLRGAVDRLVGGVGMRRGRRDPHDLRVGDALDFWRVEAVEPGALLRLRAEMKVPGRAWLQFEARPQPDGRTLLAQTAFFAAKGLFGLLYWYGPYPFHAVIFDRMIDRIARAAEARGTERAALRTPPA